MAEDKDEIERLHSVYGRYAARAGNRWSAHNPGNRAISAEYYSLLMSGLAERRLDPVQDLKVLDVGCGVGNLLAYLRAAGARVENLFGVDLLSERVARARAAVPGAHITLANAEGLTFADGSFDVTLLFTVLSSIVSPAMLANLASEAARVTAASGAVVVYDLRVPSFANPNVRAVSRAMVKRLFPGWTVSGSSLTLIPPLARRLGKMTGTLYPWLARFPLLRTHHLLFITRSR
jgi:SAM-dependent methyltransferase